MTTNTLASVQDQRTVMYILRSIETPPDSSVRESELVREAVNANIANPADCITELITTGYLFRVNGPSGTFVRSTI